MLKRTFSLTLLTLFVLVGCASAQTTYAVGNWTVTAKQDKGIKWLFNVKNGELQAAATIQASGAGCHVGDVLTEVDSANPQTLAQWTVLSVDPVNGAITGISLTRKGAGTAHHAQANHQTTVSPSGGAGAVIRYNAYTGVPDLLTRNGGILDAAVTSYAQQREDHRNSAVTAALAGATDTQVTNALAALGVVDPQ